MQSSSKETISERLILNCSLAGNDPFLILLDAYENESSYTYLETIERARQWGKYFIDTGIIEGEAVVIILKHSFDLYASFLGAIMTGLVPSMFAFPSPKFSEKFYLSTISSLLENANARMVITYPELKDILKVIPGVSAKIAVADDINLTESVLDIPSKVTNDAVAFLQYSSGTTGLKKGVAISHQALLWQIDKYSEAIGVSSDDTIITWLPLYHDMGLIACLFLPFLKRIRTVAMSPFDWVRSPEMLLRAISRYRGTLCWQPNFAYNFLTQNVSQSELNGLDLSSLRGLVNCAEPIMAESHDKFFEKFASYGFRKESFAASYAMAENTFAVTSGGFGEMLSEEVVDEGILAKNNQALPVSSDASIHRRLVSSGSILPDIDVKVVSDDGTILPDRNVGEIVIKSPCMLSEYFHNPEATSKALRDGWYYTDDFGFKVGDELYVIGRKKDLLIIGGINIYPQDIEAIVNEVAGVYPGRCVALGVRDEISGTQHLVVLAESTEDPSKWKEIATRIYQSITERTEVVPSDVRVFKHMWLLKSSSGKIARRANRQRYEEILSREKSEKLGITKKSKEEKDKAIFTEEFDKIIKNKINRIVQAKLEHKQLDIIESDPLFSSGLLDSFSLVALVNELESIFQIKIPLELLAWQNHFNSIDDIYRTVKSLMEGIEFIEKSDLTQMDMKEIPMIGDENAAIRKSKGLWTWYYRVLFKLKGIQFGKGLQVMGPLILRLEGNPRNLVIGNNVTLMPGVDLKNRENGKIIIHDGVKIDTAARLVAANDATIEVGENAVVAMGTIINAGADVKIGRRTLIAGYCYIVASEHKYEDRVPISKQGYNHTPIYIGEDVWLAGYVYVNRGSKIGNGSVVGVKSVVSGVFPPGSVIMGNPARVVKFREL